MHMLLTINSVKMIANTHKTCVLLLQFNIQFTLIRQISKLGTETRKFFNVMKSANIFNTTELP